MTYPWEDLENEEYMYRIMIVEDDEVIAKTIRQHLQSWNYEVFAVADFAGEIQRRVQQDETAPE